MGKYDFDLDLVSNNSLNYIRKRICPKSKVLEFGCANGRLTRYLKESLDCDVTIVEIDEEAGKEASKYATKAILGEEGNLDNDIWKEKVDKGAFDYIVFADVLEHLRNPKEVLEFCKKLLNPEGSMLVSIPNLANNAVIAYLWNNQFDYHSTGLLDNTHIHFFSLNSFRKMIDEIHCEMIYETATYSGIGNNEIPVRFETLPNELRKLLANRHLGDVYQYIFQFKNREEEEVLEKKSYFVDVTERYYHTELYYEVNNEFHPDNRFQIPLKLGKRKLKGSLEEGYTNSIRFDPVDATAIINLIEVKINGEKINLSDIKHNANYYEDGFCVFLNNDPNLLIFHEKIKSFEIDYEVLDYDFTVNGSYSSILNLIQDKISQKKNVEINFEQQKVLVAELRNAIEIYEQQRNEMQSAINIYEEQRTQMQNAINDYIGQVEMHLKSEQEKDNIISNCNEKIHQLEIELANKFSTRVLNKIKRILNK